VKYACQYAIIRFMPFVETGEFANIGIVLMCPETRYFGFKLLARVRRITAFFDQLETRIYREARKDLNGELVRIQRYLADETANDEKTMRFIFKEVIRPREVMLRYDAPRTVLTDAPEKKLDQLFAYYIERDFVTPDYIERRLETQLRNVLASAAIRDQYEEVRVEAGPFSARFPFAHRDSNGTVVKAIKPLHLAHADPAAAYEHGWTWVGKLRQLSISGALPKGVLLTTKLPDSANQDQIQVYEGLKTDFQDLGVEVTPITNTGSIERFARDL